MKTRIAVVFVAIAAALVWTTACSKKSEPTPATSQTQSATGDLSKAASDLAATGSAKAQELIDSARKYMAERKYQDALAKLKAASAEKLSTSQRTMVDTLKAQVEAAMAATSKATSDAKTTAEGLLKK